ncbi:hypothetical protein EK904_004037 [Melospiza melodia maxima]|nr:hypothetical protein EK904_004037 [Melospiza melodia maxima]
MQLQLDALVSREALKVMACEIVPLQHFGSVRDEATSLYLCLHTQGLQQEEEIRFRKHQPDCFHIKDVTGICSNKWIALIIDVEAPIT